MNRKRYRQINKHADERTNRLHTSTPSKFDALSIVWKNENDIFLVYHIYLYVHMYALQLLQPIKVLIVAEIKSIKNTQLPFITQEHVVIFCASLKRTRLHASCFCADLVHPAPLCHHCDRIQCDTLEKTSSIDRLLVPSHSVILTDLPSGYGSSCCL